MTYTALPQCYIEVYPFEGGYYTIQGGQILDCSVEKVVRGAGSFRIRLAPGGPYGTNSYPSWSSIITPQSLVLIGMRRGTKSQIVMVGVTSSISETQDWVSGEGVERSIAVVGQDLTYYFATFSYYTLGFLGMTGGTVVGNSLGIGPVAFPEVLDKGNVMGPPDEIGLSFYQTVMLKMLDRTFVPFRDNQRIYLRQLFSAMFETYPGVKVPFSAGYLSTEGPWLSKFANIFPWPFYEFFIATAPAGYYEGAVPQGTSMQRASGTQFSMSSLIDAPPVIPTVVARVSPLPAITSTSKGMGMGATLDGVDVAHWQALPINTLEQAGFLQSALAFSTEEVRNVYIFNPTGLQALYGNANTNTSPAVFSFMGAVDPASVKRYGYRPEITTNQWFYDPAGIAAQNSQFDVSQTIATLTAKVCSYYEPTPLMARATLVLNLRPDILVGTRFRYAPFKGGPLWDFYVEGVSHQFSFGGASVTSLTLTRGLPADVYASSGKDGALFNVVTGNAVRQNGLYSYPLPNGDGPALTTFGAAEQAQLVSLLGNISDAWKTPGQK